MTVAIGEQAPRFALPAHDGSILNLEELRGRPVALFFYPEDDTPTCTKEACGFREIFPRFRDTKGVVLGVSPDSVESHVKFRKKYKLPFTLLSDTDRAIANLYGVWREKQMFGHKYMGVVRTTFLIDAEGVLRHVIPVTRVAGHAETVLQLVKGMSY